MASLSDPLDIYCERLDTSFFAEPINALTNGAFLLAAWLLYRSRAKHNITDKESLTLTIIIAVVGLGSLAFHTFATRLALLADIIPIALFVVTYLWISLRRFLRWGTVKTLSAIALFLVVAAKADALPMEYSVNGSAGYFPCLGALMYIGWRLYMIGNPTWRYLGLASIIFIISLTLRSIDMALCPSISIGTHFLWHIFNSLVLYTLTKAVIAHQKLSN